MADQDNIHGEISMMGSIIKYSIIRMIKSRTMIQDFSWKT